MAASIVDEVAEALATCSICQMEYNEEDRVPLSLPDCRHVFCLACLATLAKEGGFPCPFCRQEVTLGDQGVQGLQKDFVVLNNVNFVQMKRKVQSKGLSCTDCPENAMALYRCQVCRANMCGECNRSHYRARQTRDHRVLELSLLLESIETFVKETEMCSRHEDKALELYCRTCHESLCTVCHPVSHQNHNITELKTVYEEAKAQKQEYSKKLMDKRSQIEKSGARQETKMKTLRETQATCKQQICDAMKVVRDDLNKREQELLKRCDAVFQEDLDRLQKILKKICQEGDEVTKAIDHNSKAERMTRPSEFVALMQSEDQHVKHVLSRPETQPVEGRPLGFHYEGLQPLRHGISQLGEVKESVSGVGDVGMVMEMFGSMADKGCLFRLDTNQFVADVTKAGGRKLYTKQSSSISGMEEFAIECSSVRLSVEKANRRSCDVTATTLTSLSPQRSADVSTSYGSQQGISWLLDQVPAGLVRYPGTSADLSVTADTKVLFSVEVSVKKKIDTYGHVAEIAIGPRDMADKSKSVCERGGTGVRCYMRSDGSLNVEGWSQGRKLTDTTVTDSMQTGQTRKLTLAFLVRDRSLTVYDVNKQTQLCRLENIPVPGQLYLGVWQREMATSQLTMQNGGEMALSDEFIRLLLTGHLKDVSKKKPSCAFQ